MSGRSAAAKKPWKRGDEPVKNKAERYSDYVESFGDKMATLIALNKAPWQKPWEPGEISGGAMPYNASTGKAYSGSNSMYLVMMQAASGYADDRWLTFKQAQDLGANVQKGQKGTQLVKWIEGKDKDDDKSGEENADGKKRIFPVLFTVFNAEQCENLAPAPVREAKKEHERHEQCEKLLADSGAKIYHNGGNRAFYRPATDSIHLPDRDQFMKSDGYYAVALHELGHWSGHPSRLDRDLTGSFGSKLYAQEELRAEIASFMIGNRLGVGHDPSQHVAYVQHWVELVKADPRAIIKACNDAEKICDFIGVEKYEHVATQNKEAVLVLDDAKQMEAANAPTQQGERSELPGRLEELEMRKLSIESRREQLIGNIEREHGGAMVPSASQPIVFDRPRSAHAPDQRAQSVQDRHEDFGMSM